MGKEIMVKWLRTYCFLKQLCTFPDCPDFDKRNEQKSCAVCKHFWSDYEDFNCDIHEIPNCEFLPCGSFCKDFKKIGDS